MRQRTTITAQSVPSLPAHVRLQFDELRKKWVVLAPERVLWPDDVSVDIIKRCTGKGTTAEIIDGLAKDYNADRAEIDFERGEEKRAGAALREAMALAEAIGAGPESELRKKIADTQAKMG